MSNNMETIITNKKFTPDQIINTMVKKLPNLKMNGVKKIYKYYSDNKSNFVSENNSLNINKTLLECIGTNK